MTDHIAIFGGSFNPPHFSHLWILTMSLSLYDIDKLLVIPCYEHVFHKELISFDHRLKMSQLMIENLKKVEISAIERQLGGESRTINTINYFKYHNKDANISLIIGADNLMEKHKWHKFDEIERNCNIIIFGRHGINNVDVNIPAPPDISSSVIRQMVKEKKDISLLVPKKVKKYIDENKLYN